MNETNDLINELAEVVSEVTNSEAAELSKEELRLQDVARQLLLLERDMRLSGSLRTEEHRRDRILEFIAQEDF